MPLIDVTLKPGLQLKFGPGRSLETDETSVIVGNFIESLPGLMVKHAGELGLEPDTPPEGVQVMVHEYGPRDVNTADIWLKLQFSEDLPEQDRRLQIRDKLYAILCGWFTAAAIARPDNFVMDLFWGPTNGRGTVDGVEIVW